tara:strand:- start:2883 stop:2996 length:114 start_codon:yes stop_codon:yes gene_type:complete
LADFNEKGGNQSSASAFYQQAGSEHRRTAKQFQTKEN